MNNQHPSPRSHSGTGSPPVRLSVVLGSYNRRWYLQQTLACLRRELADLSAEIIVVEGGSTDGSVAWLARQKDVVLILQHNRGRWQGRPLERRTWGGFMNLGFKAARGEWILMVSDDLILEAGAVRGALAEWEQAEAAGERWGALAFPWLEWPTQQKLWIRKVFNQPYVNHGLFRRSALAEVGWIDESFQFYFADFDLCQRLRERGYQVAISRTARALHNYHANTFLRAGNTAISGQDTELLLARWGHRLPGAGRDTLNQWDYVEGELAPETRRVFEHRWRDPAFAGYALTLSLIHI